MYYHRLFKLYETFHESLPEESRVMSYVTFLKYLHGHHVDLAIVRAKEDACDTCIRLSVALADPKISPDEKSMIEEAQRMHANDARTQRLALKEAIKVRILMICLCRFMSFYSQHLILSMFHVGLGQE